MGIFIRLLFLLAPVLLLAVGYYMFRTQRGYSAFKRQKKGDILDKEIIRKQEELNQIKNRITEE